MYKKLFYIFVFLTTTLIQIQFATADFLVANGSATEDAWVIYSTWRDASDGYPAGYRTQGWYKIEPGSFKNLPVPADNTYVYIRVVDPYGDEIKPLDHTTRSRSSFWMHPMWIFTVVETAKREFLDSDLDQASLTTATLYKYTNEGIHIITKRTDCDPVQGTADLSAQKIYDQAIHSVVWILAASGNSMRSSGSGVLIDKDRKFIVTNQHVIDNAEGVYVFFPYRDQNGRLEKDQDFYLNNVEWLVEERYATRGRVIAQNVENDLAIVQLDWLPSTAREIQHDFSRNVEESMKRGDKVHILGNPGNRLWNWTQGTFLGPQQNAFWWDYSLETGYVRTHRLDAESLTPGFPKIRFDGIAGDNAVTYRSYTLDATLQFQDDNEDVPTYYFSYNRRGDRLYLYKDSAAAPLISSNVVPKKNALFANYPNPFNPETWIPYQLAEPADVSISIYAADGQLVRTMQLGYKAAGIHQSRSRAAYWDGRNAVGEPVASGVYFYTLTAGDFTATRKMLIMK